MGTEKRCRSGAISKLAHLPVWRSPKKRDEAPRCAAPVTCQSPSEKQQQQHSGNLESTDLASIIEKGVSLRLPRNWRMSALEEEPEVRRNVCRRLLHPEKRCDKKEPEVRCFRQRKTTAEVACRRADALTERRRSDLANCAQHAVLPWMHQSDIKGSTNAAESNGNIVYHKNCSVLTDADRGVWPMCVTMTKVLKRQAMSKQPRKKVPIAASVLRKWLIRATAARE